MFLIFWAAGTLHMPEFHQSFSNVCVWINVTISFLFFLIQNPASIDKSDFILSIIIIIILPYPSLQAFFSANNGTKLGSGQPDDQE